MRRREEGLARRWRCTGCEARDKAGPADTPVQVGGPFGVWHSVKCLGSKSAVAIAVTGSCLLLVDLDSHAPTVNWPAAIIACVFDGEVKVLEPARFDMP